MAAKSDKVIISCAITGAIHTPTMPVEERLAGVMKLSPEMCSLNMGSMNFGLYPMVARYKSWKHDWEKPYLLGTSETIFRNTFADIEKISKLMGEGHGTKFEHECYDVGHLYNLAHVVDKGWFKPPIFCNSSSVSSAASEPTW